ncbi:MAG: hypothetical protein CMK59_01245 [Proteobacteria bacterium]|nr:hypothetical protein [Pseudomonadota bacterium]
MNSTQDALRQFYSFLGDWKGSGQSFGSDIQGTLSVDLRCQKSFICLSERLFLPNGQLDYEDSAWVHWESSTKQLIVQHFSPGGQTQRLLMLGKKDSFRWWGGPLIPTVYYRLEESSLFIDVKQDTDLLHHMHYRRL